VEIRAYRPQDYMQVFRLEELCFEQHSARQYLDLYVTSPEHFFIALEGGLVVGYVAGWDEINLGRIVSLGVDPNHRRHGIGIALLRHFIDTMSDDVVWFALEVRESNVEAKNLYRKFGFNTYQVLPDYYLDGESGLLMMMVRQAPGRKTVFNSYSEPGRVPPVRPF